MADTYLGGNEFSADETESDKRQGDGTRIPRPSFDESVHSVLCPKSFVQAQKSSKQTLPAAIFTVLLLYFRNMNVLNSLIPVQFRKGFNAFSQPEGCALYLRPLVV